MQPCAEMAEYPHRVIETVRFSETDMLGHVNNTVFGIYFEAGRTRFLADRGFFGHHGVSVVIVKTEMQFRDMIHWPGDVEIGTRVAGAGRSSFTVDQLLVQNQRVVGSAASTMVVIDLATNKSTKISDEIRALLMG